MCGITGISYSDRVRIPDAKALARMCTALTHRGPDDHGAVLDNGIGLAMRRLAVLDVAGGAQPIWNEDQTLAVIFNGEIYNYRQLRTRLSELGHQFATLSDTETIVHAYEQYGTKFVDHLHGMFAIAIWDSRDGSLLLTRDRLGVKPLYFTIDDEKLLFGSEIKAILQSPEIRPTPNFVGLHQLFTLGHILPPNTAIQGICELPAATILIYKDGRAQTTTYWDVEFSTNPVSNNDLVFETRKRIELAVERRLASDVPLGAFLSGGIDSSLVVAMMSESRSDPIDTFSIGFDDENYCELPYARLVADHFGTRHHELVVKPSVPDVLESLILHHDAPFYDSSAVPMYYLSEFARQHVTVALSGDGGDELFGGYNIYLASKIADLFQRLPRRLTSAALSQVAQLIPESGRYVNKGRVAREFAVGALQGPIQRYTRWATKVKRETRQRLYQHEDLISAQAQPDEELLLPYFDQASGSKLSRLLYVGTKTELPSDMLRKVDRMSMSQSLEVRSPFLDHELFEYAACLPDAAKVRGLTTKYLLRQVAKQMLPRQVVARRKRGFSVPLDRWMRIDLAPYWKSVLYDHSTERRGIFNSETVQQLGREHCETNTSRARELWTLLTVELWLRLYMDNSSYLVQNPEPLNLSPTRSVGECR